jgi:ankyrin repeat protein
MDRYNDARDQKAKDAEAAEAAKALLEHGADVEAARDVDSATPLLYAVVKKHLETTQQLFENLSEEAPMYEW